MLLAGHETTAVTLTWTWFLLAEHPHVHEALLQELDSVLGSRPPTAEDYGRLTYTRAVIDESMRLYPPAYIFFRRATEDDVVSGHRVYAGASLVIPPLLYHRDETWWETPDAFLPERWLGPDKSQSRPRFAFMPFSGGPRQCIGNTFALMEATLVLATLAQRFAPTLAEGYVMQPEYRVTLQPSGGLPMQLRRRADVATRPASSLSG